MDVRVISHVCAWVAAILLFFSVLTGYGITEFRIVTALTFDVLNKATSQRLHSYVDIPLMVFLSVHIGTALWMRLGRHSKEFTNAR